MHSGRGLRRGVDAACEWATKKSGGVQQTIVLDELYALERSEVDTVIVEITRRWHWEEDCSPAGEDEMEWLFVLAGGRIRSWRPYEHRGEAREALSAG